jgi:hypothetical protein
MKTALALIFVFGTVAFADNNQGPADQPPSGQGSADRLAPDQGTPGQGTAVKRIASVTWNAEAGKLEWVVQSGVMRGDGHFVPSSEETHYEITPEQAMMAFQGQQRGFTDQEAVWLQGLLHVLTVYCAESTVWWDQGLAVPQEQGKPAAAPPAAEPPADSDNPLQKVLNLPLRKTPGVTQLVALNQVQ